MKLPTDTGSPLDSPADETGPVTDGDEQMSLDHHADSAVYNLRHAKGHLDSAYAHAQTLSDRLKRRGSRPTGRGSDRR